MNNTTKTNGQSKGPPIKVRCTNGHILKAHVAIVGKVVACPDCRVKFRVTKESVEEPKRRRWKRSRSTLRKETDTGKKATEEKQELHPFHLDRSVMRFGESDFWTWRQLITGVYVQATTGAGKSSSILMWLLFLCLQLGAGAIFFTVKGTDCEGFKSIARAAGREHDVVVLDVEHEVFNWLDWESKHRKGTFSNNIVELFYSLVKLSERGAEDKGGDAYWKFALKQLVRNTIELLQLSQETVSLPNMNRVITSMPGYPEQVRDEAWQERSYCYRLVNKLANQELSTEDDIDFDMIGDFFLKQIPELHPKTRGIINSSFTGLADIFLRGKFRRIFTGESTVTPEQCWADSKNILIINLPIDEFQESGRLAQLLIKRCFQRAAQARTPSKNQRPVLCVIDEVQYLLDPESDWLFTSNCRSKGIVNLWCSQSSDAIFTACSGGPKGEQTATALLANLTNKVFLKQDGKSAKWCSEFFGEEYVYLDYGSGKLAPSLMGGGGATGGASKQLQPRVLPSAFFNLLNGGEINDCLVTGYVWSGGSDFSNGKPYLKVQFSQNLDA